MCISSLCGGSREKTRPELSADERVKRSFYLSQRYVDKVNEYKHINNTGSEGNHQDFCPVNADNELLLMTSEDTQHFISDVL